MKKIYNLGNLPFHRKNQKTHYKILKGLHAEIVWWTFEQGAIVGPHHHPQEQLTWIIEGKCYVTMQGERFLLETGDMIKIPPNVEHKFEFEKDTLDMDVFTPCKPGL